MKVFLCGFGYPGQYALVHLHRLEERVIVFTHEDLPNAPGLTKIAKDLRVVSTLESVNNMTNWPFEPDIIVSVYYRYIIKPEVIQAVDKRIINAHPSLLPRHRGCSSGAWAIIENDSHSGVTFHVIDQGIDTGPILMQVTCQIDKQDTALSLSWKVNKLVGDFFPMAYQLLKNGCKGVHQSGTSSYHARGAPLNGIINPSWPEDKIERFIRAMTYPPYPYATIDGQEVKTMSEYKKVMAKREH